MGWLYAATRLHRAQPQEPAGRGHARHLTHPTLKTLQPPPGERWVDYVYPLTGIYGANATGKSALIDVLFYAVSAIVASAAEWQARPEMPRAPFRFDPASRETPSFYQLEFVHEDRRYEYRFEIGTAGVMRESLRDLPGKRWRTLLERDTARQVLKYHKDLQTTIGRVARRELVLSRALVLEGGILGQLAAALRDGFQFCQPNSHSRQRWVKSATAALVERRLEERELVIALRVADIGIAAVEIERVEVPEAVRAIRAVLRRKSTENDAGKTTLKPGWAPRRRAMELSRGYPSSFPRSRRCATAGCWRSMRLTPASTPTWSMWPCKCSPIRRLIRAGRSWYSRPTTPTSCRRSAT